LVIKALDLDPEPNLDPELDPDPQHWRNLIHSSYREERERLTGEKVAQLLCPDEEEVPSQEEAVRYLYLQGRSFSFRNLLPTCSIFCACCGAGFHWSIVE
jgi:hypothetical protein